MLSYRSQTIPMYDKSRLDRDRETKSTALENRILIKMGVATGIIEAMGRFEDVTEFTKDKDSIKATKANLSWYKAERRACNGVSVWPSTWITLNDMCDKSVVQAGRQTCCSMKKNLKKKRDSVGVGD